MYIYCKLVREHHLTTQKTTSRGLPLAPGPISLRLLDGVAQKICLIYDRGRSYFSLRPQCAISISNTSVSDSYPSDPDADPGILLIPDPNPGCCLNRIRIRIRIHTKVLDDRKNVDKKRHICLLKPLQRTFRL
jgi:hypothetical protein